MVDLEVLFHNSSDFLAVSRSGTAEWVAVNRTLAERLGWTPDEVLSGKAFDGHNPVVWLRSDGSRLHVDWRVVPGEGVDYWIGREVSNNTVREIHHRIKNHMQMLVSLLNLQSSESANAEVRDSLAIARSRMQAVAKLYEPLYASRDFQWVEFGAYLRSLATEHMPAGSSIETTDVVLDIGDALPLGLLAADTFHSAIRSVELAYVEPDRVGFTVVAKGTLALPSPEIVALLAQQIGADLRVSDDRLSVTLPISKF